MPPPDRSSKLGFFKHLPSEIIIDILSRLPIRTIVICKCVCSSWHQLLWSREFADFHLAKSVPGLVIGDGGREYWALKGMNFFEFDEELVVENDDDLLLKPLAEIDSVEFITSSVLQGSVNGLLLLSKEVSKKRNDLYVCNPITREYIKLPYDRLVYSCHARHSYGFGVSRVSGQYKVVRVLLDQYSRGRLVMNSTMYSCLVYTLGKSLWKSIAPPALFVYDTRSVGVYLNGYFHWLGHYKFSYDKCISCFDLETETFSTISLPSSLSECFNLVLVVLGDCLCVSSTIEGEVVIWLMKEYGDEKSWTKEFVIRIGPEFDLNKCYGVVHPIKVFKNGDILMALQNMYLIYYSSKTKTTKRTQVLSEDLFALRGMKAMLHTPSFFPLWYWKFKNERVTRF